MLVFYNLNLIVNLSHHIPHYNRALSIKSLQCEISHIAIVTKHAKILHAPRSLFSVISAVFLIDNGARSHPGP